MRSSSRHGDDALACQGVDLLRQQLFLQVAVAQPAKASKAPAPDSSVGGEGEAVAASSREGDHTLPSQRLDLLGQQLVLNPQRPSLLVTLSISRLSNTKCCDRGSPISFSFLFFGPVGTLVCVCYQL